MPHGVYIHVPFCRRKCRYCDFRSAPPRPGELADFAGLVEAELGLRPERGKAATVYFGGGTPSLLEGESLAKIAGAIRARFGIDDAEVTIEVNPRDVSPILLDTIQYYWINRISIGVQSVDPEDLDFLGRDHSADDGPAAVAAARAAGFANVSVDLIYGLPGHTPETVERRLRAAVEACRPEHMSCYQLTWAKGTPLCQALERREVRALTSDEEAALFLRVHEVMADLGYEGYEVSNFARSRDLRSRHNTAYWRHADYVGLGPAAHSFTAPVRSWNLPTFDAYRRALDRGRRPVAGGETLTREQLALEAVMLALRASDGLDLDAYAARFGEDFLAARHAAVDRLTDRGLLVLDGARLRPTLRGMAVADALAIELA